MLPASPGAATTALELLCYRAGPKRGRCLAEESLEIQRHGEREADPRHGL